MQKCKICGESTLCFSPCDYCKTFFCASHMLPEVHGCGIEARNAAHRDAHAAARAQIQARKYIGHDDTRIALKKRIEEGEAARRKKPTKKK